MAGKTQEFVQKITIDASMQVSNIKKGIADIENAFKGIKMDKGLSEALDKLKLSLKNFSQVAEKDLANAADAKAFEKAWASVESGLDKVERKLKNVKIDPKSFVGNDTLARLEDLKNKVEDLRSDKQSKKDVAANLTAQYKEAQAELDNFDKKLEDLNNKKISLDDEAANARNEMVRLNNELAALKQKKKELGNKEGAGELAADILDASNAASAAEKEYQKLQKAAEKAAEEAENFGNTRTNLEELADQLRELSQAATDSAKGSLPLKELLQSFKELTGIDLGAVNSNTFLKFLDDAIEKQKNEMGPAITEANKRINEQGEAFKKTGDESKNWAQGIVDAANSATDFSKQVSSLANQMTNFFSLTNGWNLLRRAISSAVDVVRDLDEAMTGIAVVSDYNLEDIWGMRGDFSAQATEIGVSTLDLVNATTLYTQQGLELNDALQVATETMKMGRIANLEGAEATNLMTAALRGYNMELTEAGHVNDVYSNLAAKSASNQEQLATAMSKTASIAYNSGASFENMSAFLAQIIETTQEAPETAGTAMKTIIARFQELKKPLSEIGEVEGEVVDANKIEGALRLAGVALRDAKGEFRDFDDVILELSSKWDTLDKMTQRYIATQAAGSRQQSRFLALLDNNKRLLELTGYAADSAGKSQEQFNKTLESFQSKTARLQNELHQFYTNLANSTIVKGVVDILTDLIHAINTVITPLSNSKNVVANLGGALIEVGIIAISFKVALLAIRAAADKAAKGMGSLTASTVAAAGAAGTATTAYGKMAAILNAPKNGISNFINKIKEFPKLMPNVVAGFKAGQTALLGMAGAEGTAAYEATALGAALSTALPYIAAIGIALGLVIGTIYLTNRAITKQNRKLEEMKEKSAELKEEADKTKNAYTELNNTISDYRDGLSAINELAKGTEEFGNAIEESNSKAKDLIETLGLFGEYDIDENGIIIIHDEALEQARKEQREKAVQKGTESNIYNAGVQAQRIEAAKEDFRNNSREFNVGRHEVSSNQALDQIYDNIDQIYQNISDYWTENGEDAYELALNDLKHGIDNTEFLESILGKGYTEEQKQAFLLNAEALRSLTETYIDAVKQLDYFTTEAVKGKISLSQGDLIAEYATTRNNGEADTGTEYTVTSIIDKMVEASSELEGIDKNTSEYYNKVEELIPSVAETVLTGLKALDKNTQLDQYGNLKQALMSAMANGEFDAAQLILSKQELEKLQGLTPDQLGDILGNRVTTLLEKNGIELSNVVTKIGELNFDDVIKSLQVAAEANNKTAKQGLIDIYSGDLTYDTLTSGKYSNAEQYNQMLNYVKQLKEIYPELTEEANLLNQTWKIGSSEYTQALITLQSKIAELDLQRLYTEAETARQQLQEFWNTHPTGVLTQIEQDQLQGLQNDLDEANFKIKVAIEAETSQSIAELKALGQSASNISNLFEGIDSNLQVTYEGFLNLIEVFPEIAEGAKIAENGMIQLAESGLEAAKTAAKGEVEADIEAKKEKLKAQKTEIEGRIEAAKTLLSIIEANKKGELDAEWKTAEGKTQIEKLYQQAMVGLVDAGAKDKADITEASANDQVSAGEFVEKETTESMKNIVGNSDAAAGAIAGNMADAVTSGEINFNELASHVLQVFQEMAKNKLVASVEGDTLSFSAITGAVIGAAGAKSTYTGGKDPFGPRGGIIYSLEESPSTYNVGQEARAWLETPAGKKYLSSYKRGTSNVDDFNVDKLFSDNVYANQIAAGLRSQLKELEGMSNSIDAQILALEAIQQAANSNIDKAGKSDSSGGGGGSPSGGSKEKDKELPAWVSPYDKAYNLLKEINSEERKLTQLEREREKILQRQNKSAEDYKQSMADQINNLKLQEKNLKAQKKIQNDILNERKKELVNFQAGGLARVTRDVVNEDTGKIEETIDYGSYGEFAHYDSSLREIVIDYDRIEEAIKNGMPEEVGKKIEDYVKTGEDIIKNIQETEDSLDQIDDQVTKIKNDRKQLEQETIDQNAELEQDLIDGIIAFREKIIEGQEEMVDAINDGAQATINALQDGIEKYRQQREQEEKLGDIQEQERRIAIMSMDTSGANQLDILSANKSLDEMREDYTDSLIDQAIDNMAEQAERAEQQRQFQIDLAKAQLDYDISSGKIADAAASIHNALLGAGANGSVQEMIVQALTGEDSIKSFLDTNKGSFGSSLAVKDITDALDDFTKEENANPLVQNLASLAANDLTLSELTNNEGPLNEDKMKKEITDGVNAALGNWKSFYQKNDQQIVENRKVGSKFSFIDKKGNKVNAEVQEVNGKKRLVSNGKYYNGTFVRGTDGQWYQDRNSGYINSVKNAKANNANKDSGKGKGTGTEGSNSPNSEKDDGEDKFEYDKEGKIKLTDEIAKALATNIWYGGKGENGLPGGGWGNQPDREKNVNSKFYSDDPKRSAYRILQDDYINKMEDPKHKQHPVDLYGYYKNKKYQKYYFSKFKTGGLADFTGPAWLDGTKSKPEYILNAEQTKKFFDLLDFTKNIATDNNSTLLGDTYYNINMNNEISSDYDVDEMRDEMKRRISEESNYRNVNTLSFNRR